MDEEGKAMKMTLFRNRGKEIDERIQALRQEREKCMQHIRGLRAEMNALVERAVEADDLDQKILSLDYTAMKGSLNAETERFQDLSRLIARMQEIQAVNARGKRLEYIAAVRDGIDEAAVRREEDEIAARRAMMEEDAELNALDGAPAIGEGAFVPDADFACRLANARRKRQTEAEAPEAPMPAVGID